MRHVPRCGTPGGAPKASNWYAWAGLKYPPRLGAIRGEGRTALVGTGARRLGIRCAGSPSVVLLAGLVSRVAMWRRAVWFAELRIERADGRPVARLQPARHRAPTSPGVHERRQKRTWSG
jgi:hypothetical protein